MVRSLSIVISLRAHQKLFWANFLSIIPQEEWMKYYNFLTKSTKIVSSFLWKQFSLHFSCSFFFRFREVLEYNVNKTFSNPPFKRRVFIFFLILFMNTMYIYRSGENGYSELAILFWNEPKQSDPNYEKIFLLGSTVPRLATLRNGKQILMPSEINLPPKGCMWEFCIEYTWDMIVRVSWSPHISLSDEVHEIIQTEVGEILAA